MVGRAGPAYSMSWLKAASHFLIIKKEATGGVPSRASEPPPAGWRERIGSVAAVPSISYSITVRLEVPAGGPRSARLTTAVEHAGGAVTLSTSPRPDLSGYGSM